MNSFAMFTTRTVSANGHAIETDGVVVTGTPTVYSHKMKGNDDAKLGWTQKTTGDLTGAFTLWYADKGNPDVDTDDDWTEDESWAPTDPAAGVTKVKYAIDGVKTVWWRLKYIAASGDGTIYAWAAGNGDR